MGLGIHAGVQVVSWGIIAGQIFWWIQQLEAAQWGPHSMKEVLRVA